MYISSNSILEISSRSCNVKAQQRVVRSSNPSLHLHFNSTRNCFLHHIACLDFSVSQSWPRRLIRSPGAQYCRSTLKNHQQTHRHWENDKFIKITFDSSL